MLIEFSVRNFLSFKELQTFSMVASSDDSRVNENTFNIGKYDLLKGALIYGANASGKTNLIKAIHIFRLFVLYSYSSLNKDMIRSFIPFELNVESEKEPCFFEMVFIFKEFQYRYGFEVKRGKILSEWLFAKEYKKAKSQEKRIFIRDESKKGQKFEYGTLFKRVLKQKDVDLDENVLLLSKWGLDKGMAQDIRKWFESLGSYVDVVNNEVIKSGYNLAERICVEEKYKEKVLKLFNSIDINIKDIVSQKIENESVVPFSGYVRKEDNNGKQNKISITSIHNQYDKAGNIVGVKEFDFLQNESNGTIKLFNFMFPIINSLEEGNVLLIDEFDNRVHPLVLSYVWKMYNSKKTNPNNAQLIITAHNTFLLDKDFTRRDQVWFVSKNLREESSIYSLSDYKARKENNYQKQYLEGRFNAIPYISNLDSYYHE
jgi:AAA15 family ATPase/GTPase